MSYKLNQKIEDLTPYSPISGEFQIRLDANESTYKINDEILSLILEKISTTEINRYPDPFALKLCKSFASYYLIDEKLVTAGNGSDELIGLIIGSFLCAGEKMLTFSHDFSMYKFYGELFGMKNIVYQKDEDLNVDIDEVIKLSNKEKVSLIIFSNPCNPTSLGIKKADIIKLLTSSNSLVVLDEAYMDFFDQSLIGEVSNFENLIILRTSSKAIGLAGARLGFAVSNLRLTKVLKAVKSPYNVNAISQGIGEVVFAQKDYLDAQITKIIKNRSALIDGLSDLKSRYNWCDKIFLSKTNFAFIKTSYAQQIFSELAKMQIAVRNMGEYLRISTGTELENTVLLTKLETIVSEIHKN
ncbi:MAG: histidinol-phosphate transaminase [Oscillospiraceae bacterium]